MRTTLRTIVLAGVAGLAVTVPSACTKTAAATSPAATVHMSEFSYSPKSVSVPKNAKVLVENDGQVVHNWIIKGAGVGTAEVQPGATQVLDLGGIAPGTYTVFCDRPGHAAAGQTGSLTIAP